MLASGEFGGSERKMFTLEQEYYARICERDAEWDVYCHCPTDQTWAQYIEVCEAVKAAEQKMHLLPQGETYDHPG
jgi:hypothetical protein